MNETSDKGGFSPQFFHFDYRVRKKPKKLRLYSSHIYRQPLQENFPWSKMQGATKSHSE